MLNCNQQLFEQFQTIIITYSKFIPGPLQKAAQPHEEDLPEEAPHHTVPKRLVYEPHGTGIGNIFGVVVM